MLLILNFENYCYGIRITFVDFIVENGRRRRFDFPTFSEQFHILKTRTLLKTTEYVLISLVIRS